jgi:hypothetical protein
MSTKRHTVQKPEAATVEWWPAERVIPYARNPRTATDTAVGKVAASIKEFGFRVPIIVDGEGVIIAGHTRLAAAQRLGLERVPVLVAADLSPAQVKAYRIADNRTAQETGWERELLELELEDLRGLDFDLSLTGLDPLEFAEHGAETDPYAEWEGMPEFEQGDKGSVFNVTVHFKSDEDAEAFFRLIGSEKRSWLWWPESDGHVGSSLHHEWKAED